MFRTFAFLILLAVAALSFDGAQAQTKGFSPEQTKDIEKIIKSYLLAHPEVIVDAVEAMQQREEASKAEAVKKDIISAKADLLESPDDIVLGNPKGDMTLVEFFDYRCGYCKHALEPLKALLKEDTKLRLVLKSWPVLGPDSVTAAKAVLAARNQGSDKQVALHSVLIEAKNPIDEAKVMTLAKDQGLDTDKLKADMADAKIAQVLDKTRALASKLGIGGTPTFVLGDKVLTGSDSVENFRKAIAAARKSS